MSRVETLLPCPFCGGEAEMEREGTGRQSVLDAIDFVESILADATVHDPPARLEQARKLLESKLDGWRNP